MIALQKTIGSARLAKQIIQKRSLVTTPPSVKVSFAEKVLFGLALTVSMLGIPTYIAVNLKNYRQDSE